MKSALYCLLVTLFLCAGCKKDSVKEPVVDKGSISGQVRDIYNGYIAGALVSIVGSSQLDTTDSDGLFSFANVPVGTVKVMVAHDDFISDIAEVTVTKDDYIETKFQLKTGRSTLKVDKTLFLVGRNPGAGLINIKSNSAWTLTSKVPWIQCTTPSGEGNKQISIDWEANTGVEDRTGTVEVSNGTSTIEVKFIQYAPLVVMSKTDGTDMLSDSITVTFNKPIEVTRLAANNETCISINMGYRYFNGNKSIRFRYSCAKLGGTYPFTITAKDQYGQSEAVSFSVSLYTAKLRVPGNIINFFVSDDNEVCWMALKGEPLIGYPGDKIIGVSLKDFKIIKEYPLKTELVDFGFNPYNKLLYITTTSPLVLVMDLKTGAIKKEIPINLLPGDNTTYPTIYPGTITFAENGYGIITVGSNESSDGTWRVIESAKNDAMSYHPLQEDNRWITKVSLNDYDRSSFYLLGIYSNDLFILNSKTKETQSATNPIHGRLGMIISSKKNNKAYFIQTYEQYIYDPFSKYVSAPTYLSHGCLGDFSYRPNEEEVIYAFDADNRFQVLDYKSATTMMEFPSSLRDMYFRPISTTDGKYLLVRYGIDFYVFSTAMFPSKQGNRALSNRTVTGKKAFLK